MDFFSERCEFTPSRCHVDLGALARNFKRLGPPEKLMPVIKADAYGHGLAAVAAVLDKNGARQFSVGTPHEGALLRAAGLNQDIVPLMGCVDKDGWQLAAKKNLTPLAGSFEDIAAANAAMSGQNKGRLKIAIKCDTGMSRLGFGLADLPAVLEALRNSPFLEPDMVVSHLACADMPEEDEFTESQTQIFNRFCGALKAAYPKIRFSLGNSAATLGKPQTHYDILRPGFALYGGNPFAGTSLAALGEELEPVMSVSAPILHIRNLEAGESVSYGRLFKASRPMRIAVAGCGYATGFARGLSGKSFMLVNGRRAPQIGRVCMGMTMLDITALPDARPGDRAWIMGGPAEEGQQPVTAQEIADILDTIPYEIMCLLGSLNPRVYSGA